MTPNRGQYGITRRVLWRPWCRLCGWHGRDHDRRADADWELARHSMDRHGGAPRGEATDA